MNQIDAAPKARSPRRRGRPGLARLVTGIAVAAAAVGLAACGESAQEKATAQVCKARTGIATEIKKLEGLTLSTSVVTEAKGSVEAIHGDLEKIKSAQPDLAAPRKEQVEAATDKFTQTLTSLASQVGKLALSSGSAAGLSAAESGLKSALSQLSASYKEALAPISCS